jgi:cellulose synthase/poly-beta-1,6-N-acetylglucosamine synthase-like glycosyltransferase
MRNYRSALADYPASHVPDIPTVGIVIPVYNESAHLDKLVTDILNQDYPALSEIWFVDGQSSDGTFEAVQKVQSLDSRVRVIINPKRIPAAAVNLAVQKMQTDLVMRLDAHASYRFDVVSQTVRILLSSGAGGVGAIARPTSSKTMIGRAIVAAHKSRFGVGVAKFRREGSEGWVDTLWNGCYWRHVVDQAGSLREDLWRAEDNEFHARIRGLGYGLYLSPEIYALYEPRTSLPALWRQYLNNGLGVARALFESRDAISLRHLVPLVLVTSLLIPLILSVIWPSALWGAVAVALLYVAALLLATSLCARSDAGLHLLLVPITLGTLHFSYGLGTLWGFARRLQRSRAETTKSRASI